MLFGRFCKSREKIGGAQRYGGVNPKFLRDFRGGNRNMLALFLEYEIQSLLKTEVPANVHYETISRFF